MSYFHFRNMDVLLWAPNCSFADPFNSFGLDFLELHMYISHFIFGFVMKVEVDRETDLSLMQTIWGSLLIALC